MKAHAYVMHTRHAAGLDDTDTSTLEKARMPWIRRSQEAANGRRLVGFPFALWSSLMVKYMSDMIVLPVRTYDMNSSKLGSQFVYMCVRLCFAPFLYFCCFYVHTACSSCERCRCLQLAEWSVPFGRPFCSLMILRYCGLALVSNTYKNLQACVKKHFVGYSLVFSGNGKPLYIYLFVDSSLFL